MRRALITLACLALTTTGKVTVTRWTVDPTVRFRGISVASDSIVWASGTKGTIVRTSDAGRTWQKLPIPGTETLDFRDIDAIDARGRVAYALSIGPGESSRIYKTVDEGKHWELQFTNHDPKAFFDAMAFWPGTGSDSGQRGIAISDSVDGQFVILLTTDGGRTWTRAPREGLPAALPGEGAFAASGTNVAVYGTSDVWIATNASESATATRVLRSHDAGRTWSVSTTPLPAGPSTGIFSITFRDATHGVIVGGDYKKEGEAVDNVAITKDGGATWTLAKAPALTGFRSVVAYVPHAATPSIIAVGPSGADYSDDDGQTWQPLEVSGNGNSSSDSKAATGFHTFAFPFPRNTNATSTTGWAAGEKGQIARFDINK
jgi:photosystem II stability/assembly factor-like uncharacterized protein